MCRNDVDQVGMTDRVREWRWCVDSRLRGNDVDLVGMTARLWEWRGCVVRVGGMDSRLRGNDVGECGNDVGCSGNDVGGSFVWRPVIARGGHSPRARMRRDSMPRSSTILTAMRRWGPGAKGRDVAPR